MLDHALLCRLIICDFFRKYNGTGVFNQSEITSEHATNFKKKIELYDRKYRTRKKIRFGGVKIAKSNKIEKTEMR